MASRGEETQQDQERPRPVRFNIFGQIQGQQQQTSVRSARDYADMHHHHVTVKAEERDYHEMDHYDDDEDEEELREDEGSGDQPLDFSAKKAEPQITAKVAMVGPNNDHHHHLPYHHTSQAWGSHHLPAASHSSESGVSDLCSSSPQSTDGEPSTTGVPVISKSPVSAGSGSPPGVSIQQQQQQQQKMPQVPSPLPAALSAIYGPLAALQHSGRSPSAGLDPAITAATTQLLTNLAAVTNGGKGGKNTRPFKAYPRDPMSLPLGLYGLPIAGNAAGDETVLTQASNDAYAEFRRQMLSQVNATKSKRKNSISNGGNNSINGNSRPNSVTGDDDMDMNGHTDTDMPETTHIRGTVSVTDLRLVSGNEDDSEHSANDSVHNAPVKSPQSNIHPALQQHFGNLVDGINSSSPSPMTATTSNASMTNGTGGSKKRGRNGEEIKDEAYWERRRKNNEAAKRSRDARRAKEDEIAIRAAFLEQENLKLRFEVANLKNETAKLRCMIYNS